MTYREFIHKQEEKAKFKCPVEEALKKKKVPIPSDSESAQVWIHEMCRLC